MLNVICLSGKKTKNKAVILWGASFNRTKTAVPSCFQTLCKARLLAVTSNALCNNPFSSQACQTQKVALGVSRRYKWF